MKVGDKVTLRTLTYGEAVSYKTGKPVNMAPSKSTYVGVIRYIGPECVFPSAQVVRCTGGNVELGLNSGFQFYPKDNGRKQIVEVQGAKK